MVDTGFSFGSIAGEIIARVVDRFSYLKLPPSRLAMPDVPEPTSFALTKGFYIRAKNIAEEIISQMQIDKKVNLDDLDEPILHDVPGEWFEGPF